LYHDGHLTQSISSDQTVSGVAAMSMVFWAKTLDDAGKCSGGQIMRESGICAFFVMSDSPISSVEASNGTPITPITADAAEDALSSVRREKLICFSLESYCS
jgi:hypothetical protein